MDLVMLSADQASEGTCTNAVNTERMREVLCALKFEWRHAHGVYHGAHEHSFAVFVEDGQDVELLRHIARAFKQESILHVREDHTATLMFCTADGACSNLGKWTDVTDYRKGDYRDYTLMDGRMYVCL